MKKIILSAALLLATGLSAMAFTDDDRAVTFAQLPRQAQQFITEHFDQTKISYAKQDTGVFEGEYEVMFTDGNTIDFQKNGNWKEVDCKRAEVPAGIILKSMQEYINNTHPGTKAVKIERDSREYELKLSDGQELKFNLKGAFLRYDR